MLIFPSFPMMPHRISMGTTSSSMSWSTVAPRTRARSWRRCGARSWPWASISLPGESLPGPRQGPPWGLTRPVYTNDYCLPSVALPHCMFIKHPSFIQISIYLWVCHFNWKLLVELWLLESGFCCALMALSHGVMVCLKSGILQCPVAINLLPLPGCRTNK